MRRVWKELWPQRRLLVAHSTCARHSSRAGSKPRKAPQSNEEPATPQRGESPSVAAAVDASDGPGGLVVNFEAPRDAIPKALANEMKMAFWDMPTKTCKLCGEAPGVPAHVHSAFVTHTARAGIVERALSGAAGVPPMELPKRTWENLHHPLVTFDRLPFLSAATTAERKHRMHFLLQFLVDRGVLRHSLSLRHQQSGYLARAYHFETFEMVGDNTIKYILNDRLLAMFPASQGGLSGGLFQVQQLLDSNEGLRNIYEHLELDLILRCHLPNSKMKSDVVESLFGELQCKIWAAEQRWDVVSYPGQMAAEQRYLMDLLRHVLSELGHMLLQWAVEQTLERAASFVEESMPLLPHVLRWRQQQKAMVSVSRLVMHPAIVPQRKPNPQLRPAASFAEDSAARKRLMAIAATAVPCSGGGSGRAAPSVGATLALRCVRSQRQYGDAVAASVRRIKNPPAPHGASGGGSSAAARRQPSVRGGASMVLTRRHLVRELLQSHGDVFVSVDADRLMEKAATAVVPPGPDVSLGCRQLLVCGASNAAVRPPAVPLQLIRSMCDAVMFTSGFTPD